MAVSVTDSRYYPPLTLCKNIYTMMVCSVQCLNSPPIMSMRSPLAHEWLVNIQMTPQKLALGKNII